MARPLRLEFAGAVYHLTSRGNARQKVFFTDDDRKGGPLLPNRSGGDLAAAAQRQTRGYSSADRALCRKVQQKAEKED